MPLSRAKKEAYIKTLNGYLNDYTKLFMVTVDNVGSNQMQQIRMALRGEAVVLMGKNTMMRKVLKQYLAENQGHPYEQLMPLIKGNVGFVFTNADLAEVKHLIISNKVPAPARSGTVAPCSVMVPAGPTGMDPGSTSFFQALSIPTKIAKGQVEIISDLQLITKGDRCLPGQVVLLNKLNILPFSYGLVIVHVYDNGSMFSPAVLDITDEILTAKFMGAVSAIAGLSLELGYPTLPSLCHSISNAFQVLASIALETEITFSQMDLLGKAGAAPAAGAAAAGDAADAPAAKKEEEVEDEGAGGLGGVELGGDDY